MIRHNLLMGCIALTLGSIALATPADLEAKISGLVNEDGLSDAFDVYVVDKDKRYTIQGVERWVGAGFQPSVLADNEGKIHVFFQARLDSSNDRAEKMIAHVTSSNGGKTFSEIQFINAAPMQTYAISAFMRNLSPSSKRISVLTSLSIDETIERLQDPTFVRKRLNIDVTTFKRKGAAVVLEFYSDDLCRTWTRKEHRGISDQVYQRNGRDYYLAFINLIGQVRRVEGGRYDGRLILGGPLRGSYLPCKDHPHFRNYPASSSLIYSDDEGESWKFAGVINDDTAFVNNEASAVSVDGGRQILLARRSNSRGVKGKTMHFSSDGGDTWEDGFLTSVTATRCLQVLETHGDMVLCSAPGKTNRTQGTIYISTDAGKSWTAKVIEEGLFSYSTVNRLVGDYCRSSAKMRQKGL